MGRVRALVVVLVVLLVAGCTAPAAAPPVPLTTPEPAAAAAGAPGWTSSVAPDRATTLLVPGGGPRIELPAGSVTGPGVLRVARLQPAAHRMPASSLGWSITLTGARLVGEASLGFAKTFAEGEPLPLLGHADAAGVLQPVSATRVPEGFGIRTTLLGPLVEPALGHRPQPRPRKPGAPLRRPSRGPTAPV